MQHNSLSAVTEAKLKLAKTARFKPDGPPTVASVQFNQFPMREQAIKPAIKTSTTMAVQNDRRSKHSPSLPSEKQPQSPLAEIKQKILRRSL